MTDSPLPPEIRPITKAIRALLVEREMSQVEVERAATFTDRYMTKLLNGHVGLGAEHLVKIAGAMKYERLGTFFEDLGRVMLAGGEKAAAGAPREARTRPEPEGVDLAASALSAALVALHRENERLERELQACLLNQRPKSPTTAEEKKQLRDVLTRPKKPAAPGNENKTGRQGKSR